MHQNGGRASSAQEVDDDVEYLRVQNRGSLEIFSCGGSTREDKNARADDCADSQSCQRPRSQRFLQALAWGLGFGDQLVDRLAAEKLVVGGAHNFFGWRLAGRRL